MIKKRLLTLLLLGYAAGVSSAPPALCNNPTIKVSGPRQVVYSYKQNRCADNDVPDTPAMAFKDAQGRVHLFNGFSGSFMSVGSSLNDVRRDCSTNPFEAYVRPGQVNTPQSFDNWKWFRSPWTPDGKTVYGLIHNEFHGWGNPQLYCPSKNQNFCLFPNVTVSLSTNGGKTFKVVRDANQNVVLGLVTPYPYNRDAHKQAGIRAPTNIISVKDNGHTFYYLLASNRGRPNIAQKAGTCLYRSDDLSKPDHWRAWDGQGFTVAMNVTLYRDPNLDPKKHICEPVFAAPPSSWTYNTVLNKYLAVVGTPGGFGYVASADLIHWSAPKPIMKASLEQFHASKRGSGVTGQTYPSILDPNSPGLNFEYSGQNPYLYFTRFNPKEAGMTWHNRDLMRVQLEVSCGD